MIFCVNITHGSEWRTEMLYGVAMIAISSLNHQVSSAKEPYKNTALFAKETGEFWKPPTPLFLFLPPSFSRSLSLSRAPSLLLALSRACTRSLACAPSVSCSLSPKHTHAHTYTHSMYRKRWRPICYGVATISRLLNILVSFAKEPYKRDLYSAKETYISKERTNRSHHIMLIMSYGVATISRLHKNISLFCKIWVSFCRALLQKRP